MANNYNNTGTLLQRRRKSVKISREETLLILRSHINHPTSWKEILDEVKQNLNTLSPDTREVYAYGSLRQLRDRMSGKLNALMRKPPSDIPDLDVREAGEEIKRLELRLIPRDAQHPEQAQAPEETQAQAATAAQVDREAMAAGMSTDSSAAEPNVQHDTQRRHRLRRKRPLAELVRENQEAYNKFITKEVPKLMRMIGVQVRMKCNVKPENKVCVDMTDWQLIIFPWP